MRKSIFIDFPINQYLQYLGLQNIIVRRRLPKIIRFLRKLPVFSLYISNTKERSMWELDCIGYKTVVLFDTYAHYSEYAHKIERTVSEDTRLILYLLNPAFFSDDYTKLSNRWEIWTFAKVDSEKYGFRYGGTFYNPHLLKLTEKENRESKQTDVLFVGTDKGRKIYVNELENILTNEGIKCDFRIVDNFKSLFYTGYSREVSYLDLCKLICNSKVILDVVQEGQYGLTLRIMEAILFGKKVITTNKYLAKDEDFSSNENIYILDKYNLKGLKSFILKPEVPYNENLKQKYSFYSWMERLIKCECLE